MFNRLESGGVVHGAWVVDSTALRERAARGDAKKCRIALQRDWNVSPLTPDNFLRPQRKTRDKAGQVGQDGGSTLHAERP